MPETKPELTHSEQQALLQLEGIKEMIAALECDYARLEELRGDGDNPDLTEEDKKELAELAEAAGDCTDREDAEQRIREDPLSVQIRYGWIDPGATEDMLTDGPEEYEILLCTGGPACRIIGRLGRHSEPDSARLQHQDWGTPWTEHFTFDADNDALLAYARYFFYGE